MADPLSDDADHAGMFRQNDGIRKVAILGTSI
jgi:hypothetical protein